MASNSNHHPARRAFGGLLMWLLPSLAACSSTQRAPGPLWIDGPDQGVESASGAEVAKQYSPVGSVVRHSSPVWVRREGASAGTQIPYYDKRVRVQGGAEVRVGFGGRAELLWPDRSSSVVLFNSGQAVFGDQSLDEPLLSLSHVGRAQIVLGGSDHVLLPGGADLSGDGSELCGPFLVAAISGEMMRIKNQSKQGAHVRFRGVEFELLGGETLDLPLLLTSTQPDTDPLLERVLLGNHEALLSDGLGVAFDGQILRVTAESSGAIALGEFVVRLEAGEQAVFSGLDGRDAPGASNSALPLQE